MHRIDAAGATAENKFTLGNPSLAVPATTLDAEWPNAVQEELCNFIESQGITLEKGTWTQVRDAVQAAIDSAVSAIDHADGNFDVASALTAESGSVTNDFDVGGALTAESGSVTNDFAVGDEVSAASASITGNISVGGTVDGVDISSASENFVYSKNYISLNAAITAIGTAAKTLVVTSDLAVTGNVTIPANVHVRFERGGGLVTGTPYVITLNGSIEAGSYQIFGSTISFAGSPRQTEFNVRWWGAVGNNSSSDAVPFSNAFTAINSFADAASPTLIIPPGTYVIDSSPTALTRGCRITGSGYSSVLKPSAGVKAIQINDVRVSVDNIYFYGGSSKAGIGIYVDQRSGTKSIMIHDCRFNNLYHGIFLYGNVANFVAHQGTLIRGCEIKGCTYGIEAGQRAEYVTISACDINGCDWAIVDTGGNMHVIGCNLSDNVIGIELTPGDNEAHGGVVGCAINHCSSWGVKIGEISQKSHKFVGCDIIASPLGFIRTRGALFQGCQITEAHFSFQGSDGVTFKDCILDSSLQARLTNDAGGEASYTNWIQCRDLDGKTIEPTNNSDGGIVRFVPSTTQQIANNTAQYMQFSVSSQMTPRNPGQSKYSFASGNPLDTFLVQGLGEGKVHLSLRLRVAGVLAGGQTGVWADILVDSREVAIAGCTTINAGSNYFFLIADATFHANAGSVVKVLVNNYCGGTVRLDGGGGWENYIEGL